MTEKRALLPVSGICLIEPEGTQPLTDAQQRFNALSQQLASQQQELQLWQHTTQQLQQKVLAELLPVYRQRAVYHWQMAERLDDALSSYKLGKREHAGLQDIICALCDNVLQYSDDPQLQQQASQLYTHYQPAPDLAVEGLADVAPETITEAAPETAVVTETAMRQYLLLTCGIDCEGMLAEDVQELYAQMQQLEQQQNDAEQMQQQRRRQRQQQQAARKKKQQATGQQQALKETEALAGKSFKLVYQRLASMLHPDREPDEQQKLLKTGLMQQATDAYQAKDLMTLLSLQQQAQQLAVDTAGNNRASAQALHGLLDKQLEVYILNLQKQSTQLAEDILACKAEAADMVNYPHYYRAKPKDILDRVKQAIAYQQQVVRAIQHDLKQLTDVDSIKQLIQHYRV